MDHYLRHLLREFASSNDPDIAVKFARASLRANDKPFPGYLAVGFNREGHIFSRCVADITNPQQVYDYLSKENGGSTHGAFDEILVIVNDEDCPSVVEHWEARNQYSDYQLPLLSESDDTSWDAQNNDWSVTFETFDLENLHNTPWSWNVNEEATIAWVNLPLGVSDPNATDEQLDTVINALIESLQEQGYSIEGW